MTETEERETLQSPSTHKLVYEVLDLAAHRDCVDAYYDVLLAAEILKGRMEKQTRDLELQSVQSWLAKDH